MAGASLFLNLARAAKVIALLLFLLPWVTVSCSPQGFSEMMGNQAGTGAPPPSIMGSAQGCTLISASGLQLAIGSASPSNECAGGLPANTSDPRNNTNNNNPFDTPNLVVIVAAGLILLTLVATFLLKGTLRSLVGAGGSLIGAGAIYYAVMVQAPAAVRTSFTQGGAGAGGNMAPDQLERMIHTSPAIGFWLVIGTLVAATALNLFSIKGLSIRLGSPTSVTSGKTEGVVVIILGAAIAAFMFMFLTEIPLTNCYVFGQPSTTSQCLAKPLVHGAWVLAILMIALGAFSYFRPRDK